MSLNVIPFNRFRSSFGRKTGAPVAELVSGYVGSRIRTLHVEYETAVQYATRKGSLLLATFAVGLLLPVGYLIAAVVGWINWLAWLPVALSTAFIAWLSAIRVNEQ